MVKVEYSGRTRAALIRDHEEARLWDKLTEWQKFKVKLVDTRFGGWLFKGETK